MMKLLFTFFLLAALTLFTTCKKKEEVPNPCEELQAKLQGTYDITVTSYPLQTSQEGDEKEVLVFPSYNCSNSIQFNNLFQFFGCSTFPFTESKHFTLTYADGATWQGARVQGAGNIINGIFHFEGTVINGGTEYPIVLDGKKASDFMRTSAC
ncbi:MAG: hypothetical protein JWM14_1458 [Chitinophagaceae bacterium]|nr:hypothetical protein [Chitinophagaceae bacterium]